MKRVLLDTTWYESWFSKTIFTFQRITSSCSWHVYMEMHVVIRWRLRSRISHNLILSNEKDGCKEQEELHCWIVENSLMFLTNFHLFMNTRLCYMPLISSTYQITIWNTKLLWKNAYNLNFDFEDTLIQLGVK